MLFITDRKNIKENLLNILENGDILISSQRYDKLLSIIIETLSYLGESNKDKSIYRYLDLMKEILFILSFRKVDDAIDLMITALDMLRSFEEMIEDLNFEDIKIDTFVLQSAKHSIFSNKEQIASMSVLNLLDKNRLKYFFTHDDTNLKIYTDLKDVDKIDLIISPCSKKVIEKIRKKSNKPIVVVSDSNNKEELVDYEHIYFISNKSDDDEFYDGLVQVLNTYQCKYIKDKTTDLKIKPLSDTIVKLKNLDESASLRDISAIISKDIALSTKLVQYVNKPYFGITKEISAVNQAITFLGKERTLAFAYSNGVKDCLGIDLSFYNIDEEKFNKINFLRTQLAVYWYKKIDFSEFIVVSSAAMLGAIGKIYLNGVLKETDTIRQEKFKKYIEFDRLFAEDDVLGVSSEKISAMLLNKWGFSNELVNSIYYANSIESSPVESKHLAIANSVIFNTFDLNDEIDMKVVNSMADFLQEMNFDKNLYLEAIERIKG